MKLNHQDQVFLETLAPTGTGKDLLRLLKNIESHYADIRNIGQADPKIRIEALKMFREALIEKLEVLSGQVEPPDGDEFH